MKFIIGFFSVIQTIATCILAYLTYNYLKVTREISKSAYEQFQHTKHSAQDNQRLAATELAYFAHRLREAIGGLEGTRRYTSSILTENDIAELKLLARKVNGKAMDLAIQAVMRLRGINNISQGAETRGANLNDVPAWGKAHSDCERALSALEEECGQVVPLDVKSIPPPA